MGKINKFERSVGSDLITTLAGSLTHNIYEDFKEFGSNSFDAGARNFWISLDREADQLKLEDDGSGMNEAKLPGFYRLGDSEKRGVEVTPEGRLPIGQFGIATVLLEHLAREYVLETICDGKKITVREDFSVPTTPNKPIPYTIEDGFGAKDHGTTITLHGLKFLDSEDFSLRRLETVLQYQMPSDDPTFTMHLNDVEIRRPELDFTQEHEVELADVGLVNLRFKYVERSTDAHYPGIFVHVRGRAIDSPIDLGSHMQKVFGDRLYGEVHAPGLHDSISFDRSQLLQSRQYREVEKAVVSHLSPLQVEVEAKKRTKNTARTREIVPDALKHLTPSSSANNLLKSEPSGEEQTPLQQLSLKRYVGGSAETGSVDGYEVKLNISHPLFRTSTARPKRGTLVNRFGIGCIEVLTNEVVGKRSEGKKNSAEYLSARRDHLSEMAKLVYGEGVSVAKTYKPPSERTALDRPGVLDELTVDESSLDRLIEKGVLAPDSDETFSLEAITYAKAMLSDHFVLEYAIRQRERSTHQIETSPAQIEDRFRSVVSGTTFIKTMGKAGVLIVEKNHAAKAWTLYNQDWLSKPYDDIPKHLLNGE